MKKIFFVLFLGVLFFSCSEKPPIPEEKLILIYTDLMFTQDTLIITSQNVDSIKSDIFNRHSVTETDYQTTIKIYNRTPERWEKFFDSVIQYVESLKSKPENSENISS